MSRDNLHEGHQSPSPNKRKLQELMQGTVELVKNPNPNPNQVLLLQQSRDGDGEGNNVTVGATAVESSNLYDHNSEAYFSADSDLTAEQTAGPCSMDEDASKSSNVSGDGGGGKRGPELSYGNAELDLGLDLNLCGASVPSSPKLQRRMIPAAGGDSVGHESWLDLRLGFSDGGRLPEIKGTAGNNIISDSFHSPEPMTLQLLDVGNPARKSANPIAPTPTPCHAASTPGLYNYGAYVAGAPASGALNAHVSRGTGDAAVMDQSRLLQHVINNQSAVTGFRRWTPEPVVQDPRAFYHPDQLARLAVPPAAGSSTYFLQRGAVIVPSSANGSSTVPLILTANDDGAGVPSVTRPVASYHQTAVPSREPSNLTDAGCSAVRAAENGVGLKQRLQISVGKRRPEAGVWFSLEAASPLGDDDGRSQDQLQQHFMQSSNFNKTYLRIKDGKMQVSVLKRYLATKLELSSDIEVEIMCRGKLLSPTLTIQHVRDHVWLSKESNMSEKIGFRSKNGSICSSKDKVMALCYQIHMQTITLNLLKT